MHVNEELEMEYLSLKDSEQHHEHDVDEAQNDDNDEISNADRKENY